MDLPRVAGTQADGGPGEAADSPPARAGRPAPRSPAPSTGPVFVDLTGRRSRTWRRAGTVAALCCACYATTLVATLIGSDSSAPFLRLPRAMGLDRESGPRPTATPDGGRSPSPSPGAADGTTGPGTLLAAGPSTSAGPTAADGLRASAGPSDIPVGDAVADAAPSRTPASGTSGQPAQDAGSDGSSTAEPSSPPETGTGTEPPAGGGDDAQAPEPEETPASRGPLGDLVGGLLSGLLGGP
ncbi:MULTISPECIES: hypothetical protein [unclassified Streptomyces]|uniref:hypothetical protein n=1 Tax=unclassified Streptomyces TaxID=2593676 RepID=UPI0035DD9A82